MTNILISIPAFAKGKGGAEKVASLVANNFANNLSNKVGLIFTANSIDAKTSYPVNDNVQLMGCKYLSLKIQDIAAAETLVNDFAPDIIIFFYADASLIRQFMFFNKFSAKLIAQECTNPVRAVKNLYRQMKNNLSLEDTFFLRQLIINRLDAIRFTIPEYTKSIIDKKSVKAYGFYNSFNLPSSNYAIFPRIHPKISGRMRRIICIGGLKDLNKNGLLAAQAFIQLAPIYPNWKLIYYGVNRFESQISQIQKMPGGNSIVVQGISNSLESELLIADIHVICSYDEGNPNSINECSSFGVPTIGFSDCPGVAHLIKPETGILIDRNNSVINLRSAMELLINNELLRSNLSRGCRSWAENHLSNDIFYKNWNNIIENENFFPKKIKLESSNSIIEDGYLETCLKYIG